jgi:hypothetical protein
LVHTGWDGKAALRVVVGDSAWTAHPRKMGRAVVLSVPPNVTVGLGTTVIVDLWRPGIAAKRYHE